MHPVELPWKTSSDGLPYEKRADGRGEATCIAEEVPFGLPEGWAWARIQTISRTVTDGDHQAPPQVADGIPFLVISNIASGTLDFSATRHVPIEYFDQIADDRKPVRGDLLVSVTGSYGIPVVVDTDSHFCFQRHIALIKPLIPVCYLRAYVGSTTCSGWFDDKATGTAQKTVSLRVLRATLLPVPPLAEQRRIIAELDRCLSLVDTVERDGGELEALFRRLRSKVLDLAIRGELAERDPGDEPAVELLARIHDEKLAMVGRGELKRRDVAGDTVIFTGSDGLRYEKRADGRGEPVCIEDEIPFDIPETWAWARLESLCLPQVKRTPSERSFNYIDIGNIDNQRHVISGPNRVETQDAPSRAARAVEGTSTVFSMVRPYLRNIAFVGERYHDSIASTGFYVITPVGLTTNPRWLNYLMLSDYAVNTINSHMKGDNSPSVRKEDMNSLLLPVPPLSEQSRITNRIDEISRFITNL